MDDERLQRFVTSLRDETHRGPGRGVARMAHLMRGGAGMARRVLSARRGAEDRTPSARDIRRVEALVSRLGELKGLPMKFGQMVSYLEIEMPEETRRIMGLLQTQSPATPWERVQAVIREDLGEDADDLLSNLDPEPSSDDASYEHLRRLLRSFFGPMLQSGRRPVEGRIVVQIDQVARDKMAIARLRLPGRLMFLFRIRFGLYSVLARLGARCDWSALERGFAEQARART